MIELSKTARKITWILFADQSLASAGYYAAAPSIRLLGPSLAEAPRSQVCPPLFIRWVQPSRPLPGAISWTASAKERNGRRALDRCDW